MIKIATSGDLALYEVSKDQGVLVNEKTGYRKEGKIISLLSASDEWQEVDGDDLRKDGGGASASPSGMTVAQSTFEPTFSGPEKKKKKDSELLKEWVEKKQGVAIKPGPQPGMPPRQGLEWKPDSHRWIRPESKIEEAPSTVDGFDEIDKRRIEAADRLEEWKHSELPMSDEEIIKDGYKWRKWAKLNNSAWDWAVWEEIQKLAQRHGYTFKETQYTKDELLDDPLLPDVDEVLGGYLDADDAVTNWRNNSRMKPMDTFIRSKRGGEWRIRSLRDLWKHVKTLPEDKAKEFYPGLMKLRKAKTWAEAMDTDIEVLRGEFRQGHNDNDRPFVSYTTSPYIAEKFSRGYYHSFDAGPNAGDIIKRTVKFGEALGYLNPDGENEILLRPIGGGKPAQATDEDDAEEDKEW